MNSAPALPSSPPPRPAPRLNRHRAWGVMLGLWLALGLGGAESAWAEDPPSRIGRVNWTEGDVVLRQAPDPERDAESVEAPRNWPVTSGDSLVTGENARAEVSIGSTLVRLGEDTRLEVARLDDESMLLRLVQGSLALRIRSDEQAGGVNIQAGAASLVPQGAGLFRVDAREGVISATAWRSDLRVDGPGVDLAVSSGQRADLGPDGGWHRMGAPEIDRFASWAMNQNERYGEVAEVSPEMTGADDLNEYGDWSSHPEYGRVWAPRAVEVGWVPYRHGRWAWVRPWGWTWIDAAPWGFAPFHYGRWVQWGPRWVWAPGTWVARPVYAPALVGWVGSPGVSVSVSFGPSVGWFPLAPHEIYSPYYHCTPRYVRHVNYSHAPRIERAELYVGGRHTVHVPPGRYRYRDDSRYHTLPGHSLRPRGPSIVSPGTSPLRPPRDLTNPSPRPPRPALPIAGTPAPTQPAAPRPGRPDVQTGGPGWRQINNGMPGLVGQPAAPVQAAPAPQPGRTFPLPRGDRPTVTPQPVREGGRPVFGAPSATPPAAPAAPVVRPAPAPRQGGWSSVNPQHQPSNPPPARLRGQDNDGPRAGGGHQRGGDQPQRQQPRAGGGDGPQPRRAMSM
jgi:hypothetical protein